MPDFPPHSPTRVTKKLWGNNTVSSPYKLPEKILAATELNRSKCCFLDQFYRQRCQRQTFNIYSPYLAALDQLARG